jgi:ABC-2 type transport system ATP-binding protein
LKIRDSAAGEFMPVVELAGVTKAYEAKVAVDHLSLSIEAGQMFGLLGPNGAGKTSSIRMMMGITLPDSGQVNLFARPFERKSLERVGYLPEERGLYKKMKVLDQLVFFGELHGLAREESRKRAVDWARRMEIADALSKKTEELSKGMQQKIQFIGAVLHDPGLIVMDEPFSGLDPVNATLLERTLLELKDQGKAILFSTHRMDQVEKLCDSICLVNKGRAVLEGRMREIKSRYERNRVLVEFEGDPSFLTSSEIESAKNFSGHAEIRLHPHGDAQKLLHQAAAVATIYRFELVEPSLEEIFIQTVGDKADA